jgi:hypothetical protein
LDGLENLLVLEYRAPLGIEGARKERRGKAVVEEDEKKVQYR